MEQVIHKIKLNSQYIEILLSNLGILIGIVVFQWQIGYILASYWIETFIITIFFILASLKSRMDSITQDSRSGFFPMLVYIFIFGIILNLFRENLFHSYGTSVFLNTEMTVFTGYLLLTHFYSLFYSKLKSKSWLHHYQSVFKRVGILHMILFALGFVSTLYSTFGGMTVPIVITLAKIYAEVRAVEIKEK